MKLEAIALALSSYVMSFVAAVGNLSIVTAMGFLEAQGVAKPVVSPEDVFWPALGGAAVAALMTIEPAFKEKSKSTPAEVAFRAFVTMTGGFLVGFYCTSFIAPVAHSIIPVDASLASVVTVTALSLGVIGEKVIVLLQKLNVGDLLKKYLPGGK